MYKQELTENTLFLVGAGMGSRIDRLFQEWHRLGGAVLLAAVDTTVPGRPAEEVIAESTAHCRDSGRLTWVALDWLIRHIEEIDDRALVQKTAECGDMSVLGVLCDAAHERNPRPKFERLMRASGPNAKLAPFFHRVARSPLASRVARENAQRVFLRWNYLCGELRYLSDGMQDFQEIASPPHGVYVREEEC